MSGLNGKVSVITGGSRGLGFGIAEAFLHEGAAVMIASRNFDSIKNAVANLKKINSEVKGTRCDVSDLDQVDSLANDAINTFGKIDIWVNNAGISCPTGPTVHIPPEMVQSLVFTNILGVYHGSIVAMRHFLMQDSGKLINMIGKGDRKPVPLHNPYSSSRAWVRNFTLALAQEYQSTGVGVFLLNPGLVSTDMLQHLHFIEDYEHNLKVLRLVVRLFSDPSHIPARKAVWLASAATDNKTGVQVKVLTPGRMVKGLGREISRRIMGKEIPLYAPEITLVKPAINLELADNSALRAKREKQSSFLIHLNGKGLPENIGTKAINLHRLMSKKFVVPQTLVLKWDAQFAYQSKGEEFLDQIRSELKENLNPALPYAVRSSGNLEDLANHSFAGQFKTILDVQGIEQILTAIQEVWSAVNTENVRAYQDQSMGINEVLHMAVIVQPMVKPQISGVSFSINPITSLDEIVIEAVVGRGDQLVQEGVTPYRWVNKWGKWIEKPESDIIPLEVIDKVVTETQRIARMFKMNVDLEWVYDGEQIYWVQLRDITAVSKANIYSNKISKEMTPGLVKPLDWSVIVPIKSKMWINVINQVINTVDIDPNSLAKSFNYRVYHNLGVFGRIFESLGLPRESLDIMMGVDQPGAGKAPFKPGPKFILLTPRILIFLWEKLTYARKAEKDFPVLQEESKKYSLSPPEDFTETSIIELIDQMIDLNLRITTYTFHSILLMQIYIRLLSSQLEKSGIDFTEFDLGESLPELKLYDPNKQLERLNQLFLEQDEHIQQMIASGDPQLFQELDEENAFRKEFEAFIDQFGHMSDRTGVFDTVPWRETPELLLMLASNFSSPKDSIAPKIKFSDIKSRGIRGWMLKFFYQRARQFYLLREKYSSLYTYSLMLFRVYYLTLGERIVANDLLNSSEDIYFLYDHEIRNYVQGEVSGKDFKNLVQERKGEMESCKDAVIPEIIYGDKAPPLILNPKQKLTGTPTSRGYYTGKTKSIRGFNDFSKVKQGDVIVIPHSDVGWIPLFAKAGAVIAESGGMLSHSSIVAREFGIPAVVSVMGALQLTDNQVVSIDGYKGEVIIHADISKANV